MFKQVRRTIKKTRKQFYPTIDSMRRTVIAPSENYTARREAIAKKKSKHAYTLDRPFKTLCCTWKATVLPSVLRGVEVWFWTLLHVVLFILKRLHTWVGDVDGLIVVQQYVTIPMSSVSIPSGFMALLLVFFNSQCYTRFMAFYTACVGMTGTVQEMCFLLSTHLHPGTPGMWDAARFATASVMVTYLKVCP